MKAFLALLPLLGAVSAAPTIPSDSNAAIALDARAVLAANASFAKADGTRFNIDGKTQYYAGSNSYWLAFQMSDKDIDSVLDHFVASGLKIFRIWGFNDVSTTPGSNTVYFQSFSGSSPQINTGANGLQRLDYVVKAAEKRGVKLIINFVNNWTDYGGMAAYMKWATGSADSNTNKVFYTNAKIQTQYQAYIKAVVSRYVNSPAIFAWELANEPRCKGCDTSVLTDWATKTSAYIKSLDPNHMVTLGDEGFGLAGDTSYPYQTGEGVDWAKNLAIPSIDFGTYHLYPSSWGTTGNDLGQAWGQKWITDHAAVCNAAKKPCLFEEYGITTGDKCKVEGAWQTSALTSGAAAGDLFWDWGDQISSGKTADDGNTVFYNSAQWTCLVKNHVAAASKM